MGYSKRKRGKASSSTCGGSGGIFAIGQQVCKKFNDGWYTGTIISHDIILSEAIDSPVGGADAPLKYLIRYEDDDLEHLSHEEVRRILPTNRTLSLAAARLQKEHNKHERIDHGMGIAGILALSPAEKFKYPVQQEECEKGSRSDAEENEIVETDAKFQIGQEICKEFSTGWYSGNVRNCRILDDGEVLYLIEYEDGDREELNQLQVQEYLPTELSLTLAASRRWKETRKQELSMQPLEKKMKSDF
jgi:hypothetical protein